MARYKIFSAAGPVSNRTFLNKEEAETDKKNAEATFGIELSILPICPACDVIAQELNSQGHVVGAWKCLKCGRTGR